jgi:hypothetical protein
MNLEQLQCGLASLIKGRTGIDVPEDDYLRTVADSVQLQRIRSIVLWWRELDITHFCPLTSRLLKAMGIFPQVVASYYAQCSFSPYIEVLGMHFLEVQSASDDPHIAALARTERALLLVMKGDPQTHEIGFTVNPLVLIEDLLQDRLSKSSFEPGHFRCLVGSQYPGCLQVVEV